MLQRGWVILAVCVLASGHSLNDDDPRDLAMHVLDARRDELRSRTIVVDVTTHLATDEVLEGLEGLPPGHDPRSQLMEAVELVFFARERWTLTLIDDQTFRIGRELIEGSPIATGVEGDRSVKVSNRDYVRSVDQATQNDKLKIGASVYSEPPQSWTRHPVLEWCGNQLAYLPWGYSLAGIIADSSSRAHMKDDSLHIVNEGYVSNTRFEIDLGRMRGALERLEVIETMEDQQGDPFVGSGRILNPSCSGSSNRHARNSGS